MLLRNAPDRYGLITISLHWLMALLIIGMYFLGDYMTELTYYDSLYHTLPPLHKEIGLVLGGLLVLRLVWMYAQPRPIPATSTAPAITHLLAKFGHLGLYGLLGVIISSGYLISTAKGKGISVFGWFEVPAFLPESAARGEIAGDIHEIAASLLMLLVLVHALAALVHHFYYKDKTLTRMLGKP